MEMKIEGVKKWWKKHKVGHIKFIEIGSLGRESAFDAVTQEIRRF